jgi:myo-inositol-1(or 4)-monophosphatase
MKTTMIEGARRAGAILLQHFGRVRHVRVKEHQGSVVTEADLAAERCLLELLAQRFPDHSVVAEESGYMDRGSPYTWVIDPLDGTSNFAAGIPWFGVMIALLRHQQPRLAVMYLPVEDRLYFAEQGQGAQANGQPVAVTTETDLARMLCACGLDPSSDPALVERQAAFLGRLVQRARNIRATNSLVDFALVIDGRLGAVVNHNTKIWDIAAPSLILSEAGGRVTDLGGRPLALDLGPDCAKRSYAVIGASPALSAQVVAVATACGFA